MTRFWLIPIILTGLALRVLWLSDVPAGFFGDEAAVGYNAYSLLTTGKDEYGVSWPFYFRSFGDWRVPVAIYTEIPLIAIFGLSEFSVRLTMALYGTACIALLYLLCLELFPNHPQRQTIALFASLFLAISPWHIHVSRVGFETSSLVFYMLLGLWLFLRFRLVPASLAFVLAFYTYFPSQVILPPLLVLLTLIYLPQLLMPINRHSFFLSVGIFILGTIPFLIGILNGTSLSRFQNMNNFKSTPLVETLPKVAKTYFDHFLPDFLFTKGDIDFPGHSVRRHSVRGLGELYLIQLPFILLALLAFRPRYWRTYALIFACLVVYPLPSTMAFNDGPYATRSIWGVVPFQILTGMGVASLLSFLKWRPLYTLGLGLILCLTSASATYYAYEYFTQYNLYSSDYWGWQYGPQEIIAYFLLEAPNYDRMYMSGEFNGGQHIFFNFYDPTNRCKNKCQGGDFFNTPSLVTAYPRQLFSLSPELLAKSNFKDKFTTHKTIYYPDHSPAFLIGTVSP